MDHLSRSFNFLLIIMMFPFPTDEDSFPYHISDEALEHAYVKSVLNAHDLFEIPSFGKNSKHASASVKSRWVWLGTYRASPVENEVSFGLLE